MEKVRGAGKRRNAAADLPSTSPKRSLEMRVKNTAGRRASESVGEPIALLLIHSNSSRLSRSTFRCASRT
jgi:hypothetical protein